LLLYALLRRRAGAAPAAALPRRLLPRLGLVVVASAAVTAAAVGFSVDRHRTLEVARLQAVPADAKVQQLDAWLQERIIDANLIVAGADVARQLPLWRQATDPRLREPLVARIDHLRALTRFQAASLLDEQGATMWHSDAGPRAQSPLRQAAVARIARQGRAQRVGPLRDPVGRLHTDLVVPITAPGAAAGQPAPVLVLHLDDDHYLPATLRDWPTPSQTGEVAVVRRDGDAAMHLLGLKLAPDAALRLSHPMTTPSTCRCSCSGSPAPRRTCWKASMRTARRRWPRDARCPAPTGSCWPSWTAASSTALP
jgi:hypothetical protein